MSRKSLRKRIERLAPPSRRVIGRDIYVDRC